MSGTNMPVSDLGDESVREFIDLYKEQRGWSRRTIEAAICAFWTIETYSREVSLGKPLKVWQYKDFQNFIDFLVGRNGAKATAKLHMAFASSYMRWLVSTGVIEKDNYPLYRKLDLSKLRGGAVVAILPPREIVKARLTHTVTLRDAAICETLLSTAMRRGELIQMRADQIRWDDIPYDVEIKGKSPYVAASFTLDTRCHTIKNNVTHKVYISKIAGRLIKQWMAQNNIDPKSRYPVFPMVEEAIERAVNNVYGKSAVIHPEREVGQQAKTAEASEGYGFTDIDISSSEIKGTHLAKGLEAMQKREEQRRAAHGFRKNISAEQKESTARSLVRTKVTAHGLRYTSLCMQYYRTFTGHRNDEEEVRKVSGHAKSSGISGSAGATGHDMLGHYLTNGGLVSNEIEWRNVWAGKPNHWTIFRGGGEHYRRSSGNGGE